MGAGMRLPVHGFGKLSIHVLKIGYDATTNLIIHLLIGVF
jgi:hypothetical protein